MHGRIILGAVQSKLVGCLELLQCFWGMALCMGEMPTCFHQESMVNSLHSREDRGLSLLILLLGYALLASKATV